MSAEKARFSEAKICDRRLRGQILSVSSTGARLWCGAIFLQQRFEPKSPCSGLSKARGVVGSAFSVDNLRKQELSEGIVKGPEVRGFGQNRPMRVNAVF